MTSARFSSFLSLLLLAGITACADKQEQQAGAGQGMPPTQVTVAKPEMRELVPTDEQTGRFRAVDRVEVRARVSGYLDEIRFEDGQFVEKGQTLFVIDQRPFKLALEQAKADMDQARTQVELAQKEFDRVSGLRESRAVSIEELDRRTQALAAAKSGVAASKARIETAQLDLAFTEVKAPISGRISQKQVTEGNLISGGSVGATLLTTIVSLSPIYFDIQVAEGDILRYRQAMQGKVLGTDTQLPVAVQLLNENEFKHQGKVDFFDNEIDPESGTVALRAVFPNDDMLLAPGMFGRARLSYGEAREVMLIPDTAIGSNQTVKFVYTIDDKGLASVLPVQIGELVENNMRIIRGGLQPDTEIIVNGMAKIRPGVPVQAAPPANANP